METTAAFRATAMAEQPSLFDRCLYCGGDLTERDHWRRCDGRQGALEADADAPPKRALDRYRRILALYRETSREAWDSISEFLPVVDGRIVAAIEARRGATCDEVEQVTGFAHQTVSAQIRHLYEAGLLRESEERRPTRSGRAAIVWISVTARTT
jgi:DNA-binding transcriptional ArsR family regulator